MTGKGTAHDKGNGNDRSKTGLATTGQGHVNVKYMNANITGTYNAMTGPCHDRGNRGRPGNPNARHDNDKDR